MTDRSCTLGELNCFVVNLRRRPDRRALVSSQLPRELSVSFTSDWDIETDGRLLDAEQLVSLGVRLHQWQIDSENPWWARPLKWGEVGCAVAHLACWREAAARAVRHAVVLEDDALLTPGWMESLASAVAHGPAFDLLYLGRVPLEPDRRTSCSPVVVPGYSHCTYGYVLSSRGIDAVLGAGLENAVIPVDEFLPAMYIDHPRPDVRALFPRRLRALALDPPIVTQRPKVDAGSDTEDSAFVAAPKW